MALPALLLPSLATLGRWSLATGAAFGLPYAMDKLGDYAESKGWDTTADLLHSDWSQMIIPSLLSGGAGPLARGVRGGWKYFTSPSGAKNILTDVAKGVGKDLYGNMQTAGAFALGAPLIAPYVEPTLKTIPQLLSMARGEGPKPLQRVTPNSLEDAVNFHLSRMKETEFNG